MQSRNSIRLGALVVASGIYIGLGSHKTLAMFLLGAGISLLWSEIRRLNNAV